MWCINCIMMGIRALNILKNITLDKTQNCRNPEVPSWVWESFFAKIFKCSNKSVIPAKKELWDLLNTEVRPVLFLISGKNDVTAWRNRKFEDESFGILSLFKVTGGVV